ncbi:class I SAM-dependent methyltransferase [Nocardioides bruguierae]|uniref:Class I SAM-dependent methyltransferase n=1 Tax=Nocardioides bruguierae TaxID=2945102 RepID=A0A9X2D895_9ACTN|nr:class I SAM-dependent methyltransferase [Nocardioides bruguierae]MCM0619844.1 class I SAM-dependent methyltransferase [Nocardioides bruguierae]
MDEHPLGDTADLWDAEADAFDEPADHGLRDPTVRAAWRDLLLGLLPPPPGRVADLGCGTATLTDLLAQAGFDVDGVDVSPRMVALAQAKTAQHRGVTITRGDAARPPLTDGTYDVVLCRHVLWALPEPVEVLRRWGGLLRPGGRLVLVEGRWGNGAGLAAEETQALLRDAGRRPRLVRLPEAVYWGREISDDRYVVVG